MYETRGNNTSKSVGSEEKEGRGGVDAARDVAFTSCLDNMDPHSFASVIKTSLISIKYIISILHVYTIDRIVNSNTRHATHQDREEEHLPRTIKKEYKERRNGHTPDQWGSTTKPCLIHQHYIAIYFKAQSSPSTFYPAPPLSHLSSAWAVILWEYPLASPSYQYYSH